MRVNKLGVAALALVGSLALGGCVDDMYGPYGGYGGYGGYAPYGGMSVGLGFGGGYGYYGDPYFGGGYGYFGSPFGWYDDFYYPGTGIYVYDSYRRPRVWNDNQRRYWQQRSGSWQRQRGGTWSNTGTRVSRPNWSGFDRRSSGTTTTNGTRSGRWSGHRY